MTLYDDPVGYDDASGYDSTPFVPGAVMFVSSPSPRYSTATLGDGGVTWDADVLRVSSNSARSSTARLVLTPAAVPLVINDWPIERQAHVMPALSAAQPRMRPHVDYDVDRGVVGRDHVFVDGVDVTFLRNCPTLIGETVESSPLGDDRASLEFPQVKPWDIPGEGDLWMLREDAPVEIFRVTPGGDRVHRFDGFLSSFSDYSGDGRETYTVECEGTLAQAMHEPWEPPLFLDETDIGILIPRALNAVTGRRWAKIPETVTGFTSRDRGSQDQSVWQQVQNWLAPAWTTDGRQLALVRVAAGVYRLQLKEPTTVVHWTVTKGAPGVAVDLVHDSSTRRDSVYGRGVAPDGGVWANWFFPFLDQFVPPPYPMAGFANMAVGTTDADTTTGRGVSDWQRRMRELGYPVTVDGVMNSADSKWVGRVQKDRGLTVDESLGPQTWNGTFDPGPTEVDLRAVRRPMATKPEVEEFLYAANGARVGKNPAFDSRIIRHAMPGVNFGAGIRKSDAFGPSADILAREGTTGATGTITLSTDPHESGSSRLDIRAGHNVKVLGHRGEIVVQVASVSHGVLSSTLTVDERARDALAVEAILERNREARKNVSNRRGNYTRDQLDKAEVVQYESESQAGVLPRYAVNGNSGLWSVVPMFVSQVGVAKIHLEASPDAEIICALFSRPITPSRLASFVPNPLASSAGWYDAVDTLKGKYGCMEAFGTPDSPGGYWPEQKGSGPLTGILEDTSSTLYDSGYGGVVWVALFASKSTWVEGRIYPAVPS